MKKKTIKYLRFSVTSINGIKITYAKTQNYKYLQANDLYQGPGPSFLGLDVDHQPRAIYNSAFWHMSF